MSPWFENSANVPTQSTGFLYERLYPNKKEGVLYQKPGGGGEGAGLGLRNKGSDMNGLE